MFFRYSDNSISTVKRTFANACTPPCPCVGVCDKLLVSALTSAPCSRLCGKLQYNSKVSLKHRRLVVACVVNYSTIAK